MSKPKDTPKAAPLTRKSTQKADAEALEIFVKDMVQRHPRITWYIVNAWLQKNDFILLDKRFKNPPLNSIHER